MQIKQIQYSEQVRQSIKAGVDKMANAVKETLGPGGQYVVIEKGIQRPITTNDGVTIAKHIALEDPFENLGAQLLKDASSKTNDVAGDGTTTVCVLVQKLVEEGFKAVDGGANPVVLAKQIEDAAGLMISEIESKAKQIDLSNVDEAFKQISNIGTISANDEQIGKILADSILQIGKNGVITVEEGNKPNTTFEVVSGMQFDRGFESPYFATEVQKMECVLENPYIIVTNYDVYNTSTIIKIVSQIVDSGRSFLIIGEEVQGLALADLIQNKMKGSAKCCAVRAPDYGRERDFLLADIATVTGAEVISAQYGKRLEDITLDQLGQASRVVVTQDKTTIIDGAGDDNEIVKVVLSLEEQIRESKDEEKDFLKSRLAKLNGGIGVIRVGAATGSELKAKKYKAEDAMHAVMSAVEEGYVPGGGCALLRAAQALLSLPGGQGHKILCESVMAPFRKIIDNAGGDHNLAFLSMKSAPYSMGVNGKTLAIVDMFESGIIDPAKVVKTALRNAVSIACLLLTTKVLIADMERGGGNYPGMPQ